MNMISTGAFLNEMDASNKQPTVADKFAAVWEKKNAKAARAGGVSLMALSLAACGSSSSTTTTTTSSTTTTTPAATAGDTITLSSGTDTVSSSSGSINGSASTARFSDNNETVNATTSTLQTTDNLLDGNGTDADVMNITVTAAMNAATATNIETVNVTVGTGSSQSAVFSNFSGLDTVNVSGTAAVTVDDAGAADVNLVDYTRVATVNNETLAGSADVVNVSVSGATWGSLASAQTGVTLTTDTASGILETLNITSNGTAANDFTLDASTNTTLKAVNFLGATDVTARVAYGDVTGKTIGAADHTGSVSLKVDMTGITTGAVNALNWSGVDIIAKDSASPGTSGDDANFTNVADGTKITYADDFQSSAITVANATYSSMASSVTIALDNETGDEHTQIADIDVQNIAALNIISNGNVSASTSADEVNLIDDLIGDASTITITGDTSLNIDLNLDAEQTASGTAARVVTVDASGMTGTAYLDASAAAPSTAKKVSYSITGTDNNDIIDVESNDRDSTINGGAGNDDINTGDGADTVDAGAGNDNIEINLGSDTVTGGAGNDTFNFDTAEVTGVAKVSLLDDILGGITAAAGDEIRVTVDGVEYVTVYDGSAETSTVAGFVTQHGAALTARGITVETGDTNKDLKFTGPSSGDNVMVSAELLDAGTGVVGFTTTVSTDAVAAKSVAATITDFAKGDVLDMAGVTSLTGAYAEGKAADLTAGTLMVLTDTGFTSIENAEDSYTSTFTETADGVVVFFNSLLGYAQVAVDTDMDGDGAADTFVYADLTNITSAADLATVFSSDSIIA